MMADSDKLDYGGEISLPAISLLNTQIFLDSLISNVDKGATFSIIDIKNYHLQSPMNKCQYMKIPLKYFTSEICTEYDIHNLTHNGYIHIEIRKGKYGLKEADILAFNYTVKNLAPFGYHPVTHTPGLWKDETRLTTFTLCIDNFVIKAYTK